MLVPEALAPGLLQGLGALSQAQVAVQPRQLACARCGQALPAVAVHEGEVTPGNLARRSSQRSGRGTQRRKRIEPVPYRTQPCSLLPYTPLRKRRLLLCRCQGGARYCCCTPIVLALRCCCSCCCLVLNIDGPHLIQDKLQDCLICCALCYP